MRTLTTAILILLPTMLQLAGVGSGNERTACQAGWAHNSYDAHTKDKMIYFSKPLMIQR